MEMYRTVQPLEKYLNKRFACRCGKTHYAPIKHVSIGAGALNELPDYVNEEGYTHPYIVCDDITFSVAGKRCSELLSQPGVFPVTHILRHLEYNEATVGEIIIDMPPETDVIIAVGTGSITDMVRFLTSRMHITGMTVATGAPMDGFAAGIGIVNVNGLKRTLSAKNTDVIIGDTDILTTAPYRMTIAGVGDLIGKLSCLNDWELSHIINDEHICPDIVSIVSSCVDDLLRDAVGIKNREPVIIGKVMKGLVLSGVAISLYGSSRPASGAEHHMSHFWEAIGEQRQAPFAMHGEQVAVGTYLSLRMAELLSEENVDFNEAREKAANYNADYWESEIRRVYGSAANEVLSIEEKACKNSAENILPRIDRIQLHWTEIKTRLKAQMPSEKLRDFLNYIGCPAVPSQIGVDSALLKDTLMYSKEVRNRYTIMQLAWDLGLSKKLAEKIAYELY